MEATELRIGNRVNKGIVNWIGYDNGIECLGVLENEFSSISKTVKLKSIKPISLTEDWLLKFGAKEINREFVFDMGQWSDLIIQIDMSFTVQNKKRDKNYFVCFDNDILLYVHQLQNLYFALTGKELIIK